MDMSYRFAFTAPTITRLTDRQWQIFAVLTTEWKTAEQLARDAQIATESPNETARKYANQLARLHFAEKGGTRAQPVWRQSLIMQSIVK